MPLPTVARWLRIQERPMRWKPFSPPLQTTGQKPLDDAAWDAYRSNLESMGLSNCIAQYQSAYDRYVEKTA